MSHCDTNARLGLFGRFKAGAVLAKLVRMDSQVTLTQPTSTFVWVCPHCSRECNQGSTCPTDGTALVRVFPSRSLIGRLIGGHRVVRVIGSGGQATVYEAVRLSTELPVALKVIDSKSAADDTTARRFLREARLISMVAHPNVVTVFDAGKTESGELFLSMELLRGHALSEVVRARGALDQERAVNVTIQVCDALSAAHKRGIVHRDVKLSNVICIAQPAGDDFVKVVDFGLARRAVDEAVTGRDSIVGTPNAIAPEAIVGGDIDERADLYATGAMLFQMVTGRPPFGTEGGFPAIVQRQLEGRYDGKGLPRGLRPIVRRCLAARPSDRYSTAVELRRDLVELIAPKVSFSRRLARWFLKLTTDQAHES